MREPWDYSEELLTFYIKDGAKYDQDSPAIVDYSYGDNKDSQAEIVIDKINTIAESNWSSSFNVYEICVEIVSPTCPDGWTLEGEYCVHRVAPTPVDNRTFYWTCSGNPETNTETRLAGQPKDCCTGPECK